MMMAGIKSQLTLDVKIVLLLSEEEARALTEITGYGHENFLRLFYENLGTHYLKPHEKGLISLFDTIKQELPQHLSKVDAARKIWKP